LSDSEANVLHYAALLHEIGKISMPDALVKKAPGELSEDDKSELANYPIRGQLLMREIPVLKPVAEILRHQRENFDGTGYPDRLAKDEIPVGSRILRIIAGIETALEQIPTQPRPLEELLMEKQGIFYDPRMLQLVIDFLRSQEQGMKADNMLQVSVADLAPGMVTAHDVYTCSGKKLLSADVALTEKIIANLQAHHQKDPILVGVYVYAPGA
jgi:response regulator RpfG family c-di-GMP phosphodiesterase